MGTVQTVNPFRCRMWEMHDRLDVEVNETTCRDEIDSIEKHGQLIPVLARRLSGDPDHDYELIFGARRLFVARHVNRPITIEVREMSDREAIVAMDIENRQRKDLSAYERGMSYARWLRGGFFGTQEDIARSLNVSQSQVSRLLKLARLPSIVVNAFPSAVEICETWGTDLADVLEDSQRRQQTIAKARTLAALNPRPPADVVYSALMAVSSVGRRLKKSTHDEVVKDGSGNPLFRIRRQRNAIALLLPMQSVTTSCLNEIRTALAEIMKQNSARPAVAATGPSKNARSLLPLVSAARSVKSGASTRTLADVAYLPIVRDVSVPDSSIQASQAS